MVDQPDTDSGRSKIVSSKDTVYRGKIFDIVQEAQPDGRVFERAVRAPGVRVIIADNDKQEILLTREFRSELNDWDYRLPGGKVFDSLDEYSGFDGDIMTAAKAKAVEESYEEAGIDVDSVDLYTKSVLGATVEWDLYVFVASSWKKAQGQKLESGEMIETDNWVSLSEAEKMILDGKMQEERIALALLRWIKSRGGN